MSSEIQDAVAKVVWPWDKLAATPVDNRPRLRRKALIQALVMAAVALFLFWRSHVVLSGVLCALATLNLALGLAVPRAFGAVDRALQAFGRVVGVAVTWLVLVPFFYLFMLPARLILAAKGKDPLHRRFPDTPASYWVPRRPVANMDEYRKQFG